MKFGDIEVKWWQHLLMGIFGPLIGGLYGMTGLFMDVTGMGTGHWIRHLIAFFGGLLVAHYLDRKFYGGEYCLQEWCTPYGTIPKICKVCLRAHGEGPCPN